MNKYLTNNDNKYYLIQTHFIIFMNIQEECQTLINTTNKYNLSPKSKHIKEIVLEMTKLFPKNITLSQRIRAIAKIMTVNVQSVIKFMAIQIEYIVVRNVI